MGISLRLNDVDETLIKSMADYKNENVSEYVRGVVLKDIESAYEKVLEDYLDSTDEKVN